MNVEAEDRDVYISFLQISLIFNRKSLWSRTNTSGERYLSNRQKGDSFGHWFIWTLQPQSTALQGRSTCSSTGRRSVIAAFFTEVTAERMVSQIDRQLQGAQTLPPPPLDEPTRIINGLFSFLCSDYAPQLAVITDQFWEGWKTFLRKSHSGCL